MRTILGIVLVAGASFVGTMLDNFFAFAAQLVVTAPRRVRRVGAAQAVGVATLVALSGGVGSLLAPIPLHWVGLLCVAPFAFAWHAFRHRRAPREQFRRGAVTTFLLTIALGGDNVAVWVPLLRATGWRHGVVTLLTFTVLELLFLVAARAVAGHARVVAWGTRHASAFTPWLYVGLGVLVLVECHTI